MKTTFFAVTAVFAVVALTSSAYSRSLARTSQWPFLVTVSAQANVFGAGAGGPKANGGGTAPVHVAVQRGATYVMVNFAHGKVSCCGSGGPYNDANGGTAYTTDILSSGGISGVIDTKAHFFLLGVFIAGTPHGSGPARLNVTGAQLLRAVTPQLNQTFFVGDGHYSVRNLRRINIPFGAHWLVLGFADSNGFHGPPGAYSDNVGSLLVSGYMK